MAGILEELFADIGIKSDGLEKMTVVIAGDGLDTHPGNDFTQPFLDCGAIG
jgi:hypothetical protein